MDIIKETTWLIRASKYMNPLLLKEHLLEKLSRSLYSPPVPKITAQTFKLCTKS